MILRRAAVALSLLAALAAFTPPASARDRVQTVAGWRIVEEGSGDGGYVARMSRRSRNLRFEYYYEFWRGNGGVVVGASLQRGACRSGEAGAIVPFAEGLSRSYLNARLRDYLRECPLPRAEAAALHRSLAAAWPHFAAAGRRARAAMDREIARIIRGSGS